MSTFIKCPECRTYFGPTKNFIQAYILGVRMLDKDKLKEISPDKLEIAPDPIPDLKDLFDDLEFMNICCRTHLLCSTPFEDLLMNGTKI